MTPEVIVRGKLLSKIDEVLETELSEVRTMKSRRTANGLGQRQVQ